MSSKAFKAYEKKEMVLRKKLMESKEWKENMDSFEAYDGRKEKDRDPHLETMPSYMRWLYEKTWVDVAFRQ